MVIYVSYMNLQMINSLKELLNIKKVFQLQLKVLM